MATHPWARSPRVVRARHLVAYASAPRRALPDFVVLGVQKAGTSTLRDLLFEHPDIYWASRKEVHFLDWSRDRGPNWYRSWFPLRSTLRRHERRTGRRAVTGEKTPDYFFLDGADAQLHELVPHARLIVALRDPVDRAFSHWRMDIQKGTELLPFPDAIAAEAEHGGELTWESPGRGQRPLHGYLARGRYGDYLETWLRRYEPGQILVYRCEDLYEQPEVWVPRLLDHIGVDPHGLDGVSLPRVNVGPAGVIDPVLRSALVERFRDSDARLRELTGLSYYQDRARADEPLRSVRVPDQPRR